MPSLHTPERQPNESQADYRTRQRRSKRVNQRMRLVGPYNPKTWLRGASQEVCGSK